MLRLMSQLQLRLDAETRVEARASLGGGTVTGNSARQEMPGRPGHPVAGRLHRQPRPLLEPGGKYRAPWARASIVGGPEGEGQTRSQARESLVNGLPRTRLPSLATASMPPPRHRRPCAGTSGR